MGKYRALIIIAIIIGGFVFAVTRTQSHVEEYIFNNIAGPAEKSVLPEKRVARWQDYRNASESTLAILLTDTDSNWLGLVHGFKSVGLPFSVTTDYVEATRHKAVLVYPIMASTKLSVAATQALDNFARQGGTIIGFGSVGGGMPQLFGFGKAVPARARFTLKFTHPPADADPLEKEIPIDNPRPGAAVMGAYLLTAPAETPLAVYEDGQAAITSHKLGNGRAVAFGFDLGELLLKGYNNRQENIARSYDNGYEPSLDVLLRLIEDIYRKADDRAVTLNPVPDGKKLAVMLTHDIDYTRSLANAVDYADFEHEAGIHATYFMQTKYIRDYNDDVILGPDSPEILKQLHDLGMEIGSHTVSHSHTFVHFPMGDGLERYPAYHPFVQDRDHTSGGTIFGELRVSRFLIEQLVRNVTVESFRPGYLSDPYGLPQALVATNYRFSSSVTANDSLTHLPFQLTYGRETDAAVPAFEFPITIADGPPILTDRLPQGVDLAKKIARRGGICVVLIHPDVVEPKLGFEEKFVAGVKNFSWFGTMSEFGHWWAARDAVRVSSGWKDKNLIVHLEAPMPVDGLTISPPAGTHLVTQAGVRETSAGVVIEKLEGARDIGFAR